MDGRCTATSKQSGQRCKRRASPGALVCAMHGGAAPQVRAKAAKRLVEHEAASTLERLGQAEPLADPISALLRLAGEIGAFRDILRERLADLHDEEWTSRSKLGVEQLHALVGAYSTALDRSRVVLVDIARLNLEDRLVALSEKQTEVMYAALSSALAAVPSEHREPARLALVAALRESGEP